MTATKSNRRDFLLKLGIVGGGSILISKFIEGKGTALNNQSATNDNRNEVSDYIARIKNSIRPDNNVKAREGLPGKKFVLVVDLSRCRNARKCMEACAATHQLRPDQFHLNVLEMREDGHTAPYYMPKHCQHCDNPPCVKVCPVEATYKRTDGIVLIDNERCIGCRYCIAACPYSARSFNWFEPKDAELYKDVPYNVERNVPQKKGTVTKCTFSADCLRNGELPYCVRACPNGVYYFGNVYEDMVTNGTTGETVKLSKLLEENGAFQLLADLGTKPSVYYLPPTKK
ncbi:MAG: 4Fe-4S dicluster domain-containing protein [Bacteroidales bacterium]